MESILQSILSGIITFLALYATIKHENKVRKEEIRLNEALRLEDFRTTIYPLLSYSIKSECNLDKTIQAGLFHIPKSYKYNSNGEIKSDLRFNIVVKNIGLGVAISPCVLSIYYDNQSIAISDRGSFPLNLNEEACIPLSFVLPIEQKVQTIKIKLGYYNLRKDFYTQDLTLENFASPIINLTPKKEIQSINYKFDNIRIVDESIPTISSPNDYPILAATFVNVIDETHK